MMHCGAIIATPGYTDPVIIEAGGNPYGTSVTVGQGGKMIEDVEEAVKHQAKRTVTEAEWVKKGNHYPFVRFRSQFRKLNLCTTGRRTGNSNMRMIFSRCYYHSKIEM